MLWPGRLAVLFEGSRRGVEEQFAHAQALVGGVEDDGSVVGGGGGAPDVGAGAAAVLAGPAGRDARRSCDEAVVRVSAGVAYVPGEVDDPRDPGEVALAERVRAQFDPAGVLV